MDTAVHRMRRKFPLLKNNQKYQDLLIPDHPQRHSHGRCAFVAGAGDGVDLVRNFLALRNSSTASSNEGRAHALSLNLKMSCC
jgi:hypothetical protein